MSELYSENDWRQYKDSLQHHGILGQKWGEKNGPPYPLDSSTHDRVVRGAESSNKYSDWYGNREELALKRIKDSKSANMDKWGKSRDTNTLYVTGISGSGKSTVAGYLADKNKARLINLDSYLSPMSEESRKEMQDKGFNEYLNKKVPNWKKVIGDDYKLNFDIVDDIAKASEEYGKQLYDKNEKLIIEGVQILDNTLYENNNAYKGKPVMSVSTNAFTSNLRGSIRDSENVLDTVDLLATRLGVTHKMAKQLNDFEKELDLKKGN